MFGYARIITSNFAIYVRFERVGDPTQFNAILDRFNQSFPLKIWQGQKRAWQLTPREINSVIEFCHTIFGPSGYLLQKESITGSKPSQISFKFARTALQSRR